MTDLGQGTKNPVSGFWAEYFEPGPKMVTLAQLIWFGLWVITTGFGFYLSPSSHGHGTHQQLGLAPCPTVLFFNRPCPGCGLTTSWTATIHGNFSAAFAAHPLGPPLYLLFTGIAFVSVYCFIKKLRIRSESKPLNRAIIAIAILFFSFGVVRFIMVNNYAAPHESLLRSGVKLVEPNPKH